LTERIVCKEHREYVIDITKHYEIKSRQ
jgi:hypothetical protein